ncbi:MAG: nuclear transport factor 2 family protein, partial [Thermoanaerobaculales bacterium]|nr:nuclear transport factor 2 family protein [Thermoanaerobaculales bacterium]
MKTIPIASIVRGPELLWLAFLVFASWSSPSVSFAAEPVDDERRQIENLIGAYYVAVAAEDVDNVVDLHHWENSFERDKVTALVEQAFAVTNSEFERIRVQSIELYPERNVGLARVGVDYVVRNSDRSDAFSGHLDVAVVLVNGRRGWRIGKVGRAADFDLTAAVSQFAAKSQELEKTVQEAPVGMAETPSTVGKLPKLATATVPVVQNPAAETGVVKVGPSAASTTGGLTFFSLRRKTSGECEVVAGVEGIAPGDTIYGAFPDFGRAQEAVSANCTGGQPEAA